MALLNTHALQIINTTEFSGVTRGGEVREGAGRTALGDTTQGVTP